LAAGSIPDPDWGRAVAEAVSDPLIVVGEGRILIANRAAQAVLGDWIEGRDVRLVVRHPAAVARLLGRGDGEDEVEIVGIGGPERRWTMSVTPFGEGYRAVRFADVSARHAAEQMRVDFVADASHELRTPLATLLGFLETLRGDDARADPDTLDRFLAIMEGEAKRMQRLTDDLLSLSRIEATRFSAPDEAVELAPLAEEARANLRHFAEERGCDVTIEAADGLPPVTGDRAELLQLLDNLIGNALRYGRRGSRVTVSLERDGPMLRLAVRDEGEGIAAEHIPRLTQRFYRVDAGRSRAAGGTGLGLAIVKHIVERHRGQLEIESKVGLGTTVHVRLPIA
jgi:two-component system phosphate regulon sensor histidine kinase PhoR